MSVASVTLAADPQGTRVDEDFLEYLGRMESDSGDWTTVADATNDQDVKGADSSATHQDAPTRQPNSGRRTDR